VASATAALLLTQVAFAALVKKGILQKTEAEQILTQAIEAINTRHVPGGRAAEMLGIIQERFSEFKPPGTWNT
jgi:hypothetical protein